MTSYEELMITLLHKASKELTYGCDSTKRVKEQIDSFLNGFLIPKKEFNDLI